jgi:hypothetical protein
MLGAQRTNFGRPLLVTSPTSQICGDSTGRLQRGDHVSQPGPINTAKAEAFQVALGVRIERRPDLVVSVVEHPLATSVDVAGLFTCLL